MKRSLLIILILIQISCTTKKEDLSKEFECLINTSKTVYKVGEIPDLQVSIINKIGKEVYLIENLDGSEIKWRMPYCYYRIKKPKRDSIGPAARCGNMNSIRKEDFKLIKSGEKFNPYGQISEYNKAFELTRQGNFRNTGKYQITFFYSTKSNDLTDFVGDGIYGKEKIEIAKLFKLLPSIELTSNTLEIEIKP